MAHELDLTRQEAAIAYVGDVPWHGLGHRLSADADLETWIKQAQLDYEVLSSRMAYYPEADGDNLGAPKAYPNRTALYRSDNFAPLSVVSDRYKVVQPREVMEFFKDVASDNSLKLETAGALKGGATYWALARLDDSLSVAKDDIVLPYVLLATSCDGSMATTATLTSVRVVCMNTLSYARSQAKNAVKIPHNSVFDANKTKIDLGLLGDQWSDFGAALTRLSRRKVTEDEKLEFTLRVFLTEEKAVQEQLQQDTLAPSRSLPNVDKVLSLVDSGVGQLTSAARGTAFGLVQAVTRFYDHEVKSGSNDARLRSAWFGTGQRNKARAMELALNLIGESA